MEERTARLTLLIDPRKKAVFESLCAREDVTPSQKVRQFIRDYIEQKLGADWLEQSLSATTSPARAAPSRSSGGKGARRGGV